MKVKVPGWGYRPTECIRQNEHRTHIVRQKRLEKAHKINHRLNRLCLRVNAHPHIKLMRRPKFNQHIVFGVTD